MAQKRNFNYEKRQKELRKQKKKQEKLEAKRAKREAKNPEAVEGLPEDGVVDGPAGADQPEAGPVEPGTDPDAQQG